MSELTHVTHLALCLVPSVCTWGHVVKKAVLCVGTLWEEHSQCLQIFLGFTHELICSENTRLDLVRQMEKVLLGGKLSYPISWMTSNVFAINTLQDQKMMSFQRSLPHLSLLLTLYACLFSSFSYFIHE